MIPGSSVSGFFRTRDSQYQIERSLRFNRADSAYLSRTPSVSTNNRTWTWSAWVKLSEWSDRNGLLFSQDSGVNYTALFNKSSGDTGAYTLEFRNVEGTVELRTTAVYRDPTAWYHIVLAVDTTQATSTNRVRLYVNGVEISFTSGSFPAQNADTYWNNTFAARLGSQGGATYSSLYMTEVHNIGGQQLTPSSFGETNAITGAWDPINYTGSYGTNGFYLKFADNSGATSTTLGKDSSGNGNNWTPNNFSVTAGAGNDSLTDTPTNYGTGTDTGGVMRGNYCTWNSVWPSTSALTNGNLDAAGVAVGTFALTSGKWYWETTANVAADGGLINSAGIEYTTAIALGVTRGFRYDASTTTLESTVNGSTWTTISAAVAGTPFPYVKTASTTTNFGQRAFVHTPPTSGFLSLCTQNIAAPVAALQNPRKGFTPTLYTGTGASLSITGLNFAPEFVWVKSRSAATDHALYDSSRGTQARLESNTTDAEATSDNGLTAFGSAGFTLGTLAQVNTSSVTYVAWCWEESATYGIDVVLHTITSSTNTIAHNLGVAPGFIVGKTRNAVSNWWVFHQTLGAGKYMTLSSTAAEGTNASVWANTTPTASNFYTTGSGSWYTDGDQVVFYVWAPVSGFSFFGSYTGNGSTDGPVVACGFSPAYVGWKRSDATADWYIRDPARSPYNSPTSDTLYPNLGSGTGGDSGLDFLAMGWKRRDPFGASAWNNASGGTYITWHFAQDAFKYARAV